MSWLQIAPRIARILGSGPGNLIETPAYELAAEAILSNDSSHTLIGESLGQYQILRLLGRGGLGVVFLAFKELMIDLKRLSREIEAETSWESPASTSTKSAIQSQDRADSPAPTSSSETKIGSLDSGRIATSGKKRYRRTINSLAVMPLTNVNADPEAEYLSDGITESIINNLSQLPKLRVMARSTVFRFKGQDFDPQEVGNALGVHAVLTGRLHQVRDSLVISAELVRVADGSQLWGQHFNSQLGDIFSVQEEIAKQISDKLQTKSTSEDKQRLAKRPTQSAEAYRLYLKGRYFWKWYLVAMGQFERSVDEGQLAIDLDPLAPATNLALSKSYFFCRRYDDAIKLCQYTLSLDSAFVPARYFLGQAYMQKAKFDEALAEYEKGLRVLGDLPFATAVIAHAQALAGNKPAAQTALDKLLDRVKSSDTYIPAFGIAMIYAGLGNKAAVLNWLERAYDERSLWMVYLNVDPTFDSLRDEPGFKKLLGKMKFPRKAKSFNA